MTFDTPRPDELPLVYDAWARSFRKSPWAGCIPNRLYDSVSRAGIDDILNRGARVIVAVVELEGGARRVMGYVVAEPDWAVLHWLYVKEAYRGMGVGRALLERVTAEFPPGHDRTYTYRTPASAKFLGSGWDHDPVPARVKR